VGVVAAPAEVPSLDPPVHRDGITDDEAMFFARLAATDPVTALESMRADFEQWVAGLDPADGNDPALASRWLGILPDADRARVERAGATELAAAAREAVGRSEGYLRDAAISFRAWPFDVAAVQVPVHAWYGSADPNYSTRNGTWLVEHAGADLVVRDCASHLATLVDHWEDMLVTLTRRSTGS
jgi:pimeloyl-ACP methyl ester carboxylesterase